MPNIVNSDESKNYKGDPLFIGTLAKGMRVLEAFGDEKSDWSLTEIAQNANISVSAAQRHIHSFVTLGYLTKVIDSKRYRLTAKILKPTHNYLKTNILVRVTTPFIIQLQQYCPNRVDLTIRDGIKVIVLTRSINQSAQEAQNPIGRTLHLAHSSGGRAIMAHLLDKEIDEILEQTPKTGRTPFTLISDDDIKQKISSARDDGFSIAIQESILGQNVLSAAITNNLDIPIAALHVSAATAQWPEEKIRNELAPHLLNTIASIDHLF